MKILLRFILMVFVLYLCYSILADAQTMDRDIGNREIGAPPAANKKKDINVKEKTHNLNGYEYDRTGLEDDDFFPYDQDYLTRKLFQKEWGPLTRRERIIWSFRMANSNVFL
jgi:hypothetical protein